MAASVQEDLLKEELTCPICYQIFSNPVMLLCGHNYCLSCLEKTFKGQSEQGSYSCPECRCPLGASKPTLLQKNFKLANIVEHFEATNGAKVFCDHCHCQAARTCFRGESSLCKDHLKLHLELPAFKDHLLLAPTKDLSKRRCSEHRKAVELFCFDCKTYACTECIAQGGHITHSVKPLETAQNILKMQLKSQLDRIKMKMKKAEGVWQKQVNQYSIKKQFAEMKQKESKYFESLCRLVAKYQTAVMKSIEDAEQQAQRDIEDNLSVINAGYNSIDEVRKAVQKLLYEKDSLQLIQGFQSIGERIQSVQDAPLVHPSETCCNKSQVLDVRDKYHREFKVELEKLHQMEKDEQPSYTKLSFNPNTAYPSLVLSDDLKTVKWIDHKQLYPEHPERFDVFPQVLCSQSFSKGCHYWEVETGGVGFWGIGVAYNTIERKGSNFSVLLGFNPLSWQISLNSTETLKAMHNHKRTALSVTEQPKRIGVKLDCDAGTVSFYHVTDTQIHLHTFRTTFTQPVYPAFYVPPNTEITLQSAPLNEIKPKATLSRRPKAHQVNTMFWPPYYSEQDLSGRIPTACALKPRNLNTLKANMTVFRR
ncbi:zinc-binding protein A33-like [Latimeria chalumnae]|uniref:zinc-binding protein A33-like n=1 Tax=Latimeria chalumnae TaxID=7897 RepID=UPI0003C1480F|nr:PREDICTED: zinc-binding protein A33-like [Latimeria chalumnae]|eukprot:XP_005998723.1 PREDICTED: zinc-binding protein A33-like [Latimeria chalumnae]